MPPRTPHLFFEAPDHNCDAHDVAWGASQQAFPVSVRSLDGSCRPVSMATVTRRVHQSPPSSIRTHSRMTRVLPLAHSAGVIGRAMAVFRKQEASRPSPHSWEAPILPFPLARTIIEGLPRCRRLSPRTRPAFMRIWTTGKPMVVAPESFWVMSSVRSSTSAFPLSSYAGKTNRRGGRKDCRRGNDILVNIYYQRIHQ